jgi:hypothetical protein
LKTDREGGVKKSERKEINYFVALFVIPVVTALVIVSFLGYFGLAGLTK